MLTCLLRNQAIDSEFVQRDAMVLMDIGDRLGRVEFEFLVEKKMGTENKDNLLVVDGFVSSRIDRSFCSRFLNHTLPVQLTFSNQCATKLVPTWLPPPPLNRCTTAGAHTGNHRIRPAPLEATFQTCSRPSALDAVFLSQSYLRCLSTGAVVFRSISQCDASRRVEFDMDDKPKNYP